MSNFIRFKKSYGYGCIAVDDEQYLICIGNKEYDLRQIEDVKITFIEKRMKKHLIGNVFIEYKFSDRKRQKEVIKKGEKTEYRVVGDTVNWYEPPALTEFKKRFNGLLKKIT